MWETELKLYKKHVEYHSEKADQFFASWKQSATSLERNKQKLETVERERTEALFNCQKMLDHIDELRKQVNNLSRRSRIWSAMRGFFTSCCSRSKKLEKPGLELDNKKNNLSVLECLLEGGWTPYHTKLSEKIVNMSQTLGNFKTVKSSILFSVRVKSWIQIGSADTYTLDLGRNVQVNDRTKVERPIRLTTIQVERQAPRLPSVSQRHESLCKVEDAFFNQMSAMAKTNMRQAGAKIVCIETITNPKLEFLYSCKKYVMDFPNEKKFMFHSTGTTDYKELVLNGPDFRCSSDRNLYGQGFYSSIDPLYCHQIRPHEITKESKRQEKTYVMLVFSILAGNCYNASLLSGKINHWRRPPILEGSFDSLVADQEGTRMYVTFDNSQSLLTHVITYRM